MDADEEHIAAAEAADLADPRNAPQMLRAAELCLARGDLPRAARLARAAAAAAPAQAAPPRVLSGILWEQGQTEAAMEAAREAVRLAPAAGALRLHLGSVLLSLGEWRQAADHLAVCVQALPDAPVAWHMLSAALQEMGRTPRALEAIERAIALAPEAAEYRVHRGSLLGACGRYGDAIAALTGAAALCPHDAGAWRALSGMQAAVDELAAALQTAERACALAPDKAEYAAHLAHVSGLLGLPAHAPVAADGGYWTARVRAPRRAAAPRVDLSGLLAIQARIVCALMLRDMRTRFARSRLGYVWAILEPLSHIATLGSVFSLLNHAPPPVGEHLFEFYLTGLLPFLMFSHVSNEVMTGFAANAPVLQIPLVKRIDVIAARALLSLATEVLVGVLVFAAAALIGWQGMPANLAVSLVAILALWLMAAGIGALNLVLVELIPAWETFFAALVRMLYFASGIYYSPIAMPGPIRAVLAYNPVLQAIEWFRSGFYAFYEPHWLDRQYVVLWALGALLTGLAAERALRHRMMVAA
jgi:capsular polysaccharide transport system permease protein